MAQQQILAGTLPKRLRSVEMAAESYLERKDEQATAKERADEAKDALIAAMRKNDIDRYERGGFSITLDSTDTVKVKRKPEGKEAEEEEDGE